MVVNLLPVVWNAPLVNPAPSGLWSAVQWTEEEGPLRWLGPGLDVKIINFGGSGAYGEWTADPFATTAQLLSTDKKTGNFPADGTDPADVFYHFTSWGADDCDLTQESQDLVVTRAQQILRLNEPTQVERDLAPRLLADAGTVQAKVTLTKALAYLEGQLAITNTLGQIHASAELAAPAAALQLIRYSGSNMLTPMGHQWVFGGGYISGLGNTLVASSQVFGWRGPVTVGTAIKQEWNRFYAIAERSLVLGYEVTLGAASFTP